MILLITLLFYFLSLSKKNILWLIIPVSFFMDFWEIKPLGLSGLEMLVMVVLLHLLLASRIIAKEKYKII